MLLDVFLSMVVFLFSVSCLHDSKKIDFELKSIGFSLPICGLYPNGLDKLEFKSYDFRRLNELEARFDAVTGPLFLSDMLSLSLLATLNDCVF